MKSQVEEQHIFQLSGGQKGPKTFLGTVCRLCGAFLNAFLRFGVAASSGLRFSATIMLFVLIASPSLGDEQKDIRLDASRFHNLWHHLRAHVPKYRVSECIVKMEIVFRSPDPPEQTAASWRMLLEMNRYLDDNEPQVAMISVMLMDDGLHHVVFADDCPRRVEIARDMAAFAADQVPGVDILVKEDAPGTNESTRVNTGFLGRRLWYDNLPPSWDDEPKRFFTPLF